MLKRSINPPKQALLVGKPATIIVSQYRCPTCETIHRDEHIAEHILRVRCTQCGQELILRD